MSADSLESFILAYLERTAVKISAADLIRTCAQACRADRAAVQAALRRLAADGQIQYTNLYGSSQIDLAWSRPRWVSPHILLCPKEAGAPSPAPGGAVVLRIAAGAAFGAGDHPTTRLALQSLDAMFGENRVPPGATVLDIGTGSGVLAIGAALLGARSVLALDVDPCALWEARANVALNGLEDRIRVSADPVEALAQTFDLVLANLRLPTLLGLVPTMSRVLGDEGVLVISGIRPEEAVELMKSGAVHGFEPCWLKESQGWAGIGFRRGR